MDVDIMIIFLEHQGFSYEAIDDFLEHHGVKGQKWGVINKSTSVGGIRKKIPEHLTPNKTDATITKNVKNDYNTLTNKEFFKKYITTKRVYAKRVAKFGDPYIHAVDQMNKNSTAGSRLKLSPDQAVLATYGAVIAASVLITIGKRHADSGIRDAKRTGDRPFKQNPKLKGKKSVSQIQNDVVKQINPNYGSPGTKMNCRRATMAYEMRRRGYDVKATKSKYATGGTIKNVKKVNTISKDEKFESLWGQTRISTPTEYARMTPLKKSESLFDSLSKSYPNGARGEIGSAWIMGGGHSQAFEIINHKPVIFDTQNGKTYTSPAAYSSFTGTTREIAHTRLDNRTLDNEFIKRWVTDADA